MAVSALTGTLPRFITQAAISSTTTTQIQASPWHRITIFSASALYIYNDVADGDPVPASNRLAITAAQAASGYPLQLSGAVAGQTYTTLCVAAQATTADIVIVLEPSEVRS